MKKILSFTLAIIWLGTIDTKAQILADSLSISQQSLQLNLGTQGIGVAYTHGFMPKLAARVGLNVIPIKANDVFKISGFNSSSRVSAEFYNVHLLADYTPITQAPWLRIVGGLAYFVKAEGKVRITPSNNYMYGDISLTEEQMGYVDLNVDWKGLSPYLGIGLLPAFPKQRFNINLDLGTYYLPKPKADIIGTGLLSGNSSQTEQFQANIKDYRWLPIIQINFNYKL